MKTSKIFTFFGALSWICLITIAVITNSIISHTMIWIYVPIAFILCLASLLTKKYKDGTKILLHERVERCMVTFGTTGIAALLCFFLVSISEHHEEKRTRERKLIVYAPRLVTVKTAFEGNDSIELKILASWEYQPFNVGEKVNLCRTFWSGDNSLNKVTRDMFISPSVDHDRNDVWISRYSNKKDSLLERISISETVVYRAYRYTVSKKAIILYDPKLDP